MRKINDNTNLYYEEEYATLSIIQYNEDETFDIVALSAEDAQRLAHEIDQTIRVHKALGKL